MKLLEKPLFDNYISQQNIDLGKKVSEFHSQKLDLGYHIKASSVYSSNIEGNTLNLNSYMNIKLRNELKKNREVQEIDDLVESYEFSMDNTLNEVNFLHSHKILSKTILIDSKQGKYREESIGVFSETGLVYLAVEPGYVIEHMNDLFTEISKLLEMELDVSEIFYFSSLLHLRFVHIHPFTDGNGRAARLLEKWFLTTKLGNHFWNLQSEKYYKENQQDYYKNLNLGVNFYELEYKNALPFLLMLPKSIV
jgi:Fic family protein